MFLAFNRASSIWNLYSICYGCNIFDSFSLVDPLGSGGVSSTAVGVAGVFGRLHSSS